MLKIMSTHLLDKPHPVVPRLTHAQVLALDCLLRMKVEIFPLKDMFLPRRALARSPSLAHRFVQEYKLIHYCEVKGEALAAVVEEERRQRYTESEEVEVAIVATTPMSVLERASVTTATLTADLRSTPKVAIGFKVTSKGESVFIRSKNEGGLAYPSYEWVYPAEGCGPISVFTSQWYACEWLRGLDDSCRKIHSRVRRCVYKPSPLESMWTPYWRVPIKLDRTPSGTVLADAVMCLED